MWGWIPWDSDSAYEREERKRRRRLAELAQEDSEDGTLWGPLIDDDDPYGERDKEHDELE